MGKLVIYDKVIYSPIHILLKISYSSFLLVVLLNNIVLLVKEDAYSLVMSAIAILGVLAYSVYFMSGYIVRAGINKKGIWIRFFGWITWDQIEGVEIKKSGLKKRKCIFLKIKDSARFSFMKKLRLYLSFFSSPKNIRFMCQRAAGTPVEEMLEELKGYIEKYGKKS